VAICGEKIKAKAMEAGFDFCGIAKAEPLEDARTYYTEFIAQNKHGDLQVYQCTDHLSFPVSCIHNVPRSRCFSSFENLRKDIYQR